MANTKTNKPNKSPRLVVGFEDCDDFVPTTPLCISCEKPVDVTTSHYGRVVIGFASKTENDRQFKVSEGRVIQFDTYTEKFFPRKKTGECCPACWEVLYNQTSRDSSGHLRRAFENVSREVIQPKGDDYEASNITKGLYAPHASRAAFRPGDYEHRPLGSKQAAAVIETHQIKKENLAGFKQADVRLEIPDDENDPL